MILETLLQAGHQIPVQLHGMHRSSGRRQQTIREGTASGPHLEHAILGLQVRRLQDAIKHSRIAEPVLPEAFAGGVAMEAHGFTVHQLPSSAELMHRKPAHAPAAAGQWH